MCIVLKVTCENAFHAAIISVHFVEGKIFSLIFSTKFVIIWTAVIVKLILLYFGIKIEIFFYIKHLLIAKYKMGSHFSMIMLIRWYKILPNPVLYGFLNHSISVSNSYTRP